MAANSWVNFVDDVRHANDIVDVISEYLQLVPTGRSFKGLCPFHVEKTPSFMVSREKQVFHCFGCAAGGDVFNFIMRIEGVEFPEAVRMLAERAGVRPPEDEPFGRSGSRGAGGEGGGMDAATLQRPDRREAQLSALEMAASFFEEVLRRSPQDGPVWQYLRRRGITPEVAKRFRLGWAPARWDALWGYLSRRGVEAADALAVGLIAESKSQAPHGSAGGQGGGRYYDRFRERLIFPIADVRGRVIAFGGRLIAERDGPKYLNSPETPLFRKGRTLYGLHLATEAIRREGKAIIVEGYMDVIACHQHGLENAVASLGTALTIEQARLLRRFTDSVTLAFDADTAGNAASLRGLDLVDEAGLRVRVASFPAGDDPDSFVRREGREAARRVLDAGLPLVEYKIEAALAGLAAGKGADAGQGGNIAEKLDAVNAVVPVLVSLRNEVEKDAYIDITARRIGVNVHALAAEVARVAEQAKSSRSRKLRHRPDGGGHTSEQLTRIMPGQSPPRAGSWADGTAEPGPRQTPGLGGGGPALDSGPSSSLGPASKAVKGRAAATNVETDRLEREVLQLMLQRPEAVSQVLAAGGVDVFDNEVNRQLAERILARAARGWPTDVRSAWEDPALTPGERELLSGLLLMERNDRLPEPEVAADRVKRIWQLRFQAQLETLLKGLEALRVECNVRELNAFMLEFKALRAEAARRGFKPRQERREYD